MRVEHVGVDLRLGEPGADEHQPGTGLHRGPDPWAYQRRGLLEALGPAGPTPLGQRLGERRSCGPSRFSTSSAATTRSSTVSPRPTSSPRSHHVSGAATTRSPETSTTDPRLQAPVPRAGVRRIGVRHDSRITSSTVPFSNRSRHGDAEQPCRRGVREGAVLRQRHGERGGPVHQSVWTGCGRPHRPGRQVQRRVPEPRRGQTGIPQLADREGPGAPRLGKHGTGHLPTMPRSSEHGPAGHPQAALASRSRDTLMPERIHQRVVGSRPDRVAPGPRQVRGAMRRSWSSSPLVVVT